LKVIDVKRKLKDLGISATVESVNQHYIDIRVNVKDAEIVERELEAVPIGMGFDYNSQTLVRRISRR